ncbi:uncharacterized protein I303_105268 [Kwoniella dejecticola CBS 10117]|uniref:Zinc finger PHD-type domain-containing protein n=1 Tax=Kwoniella dejecticola CBS 10117 TaxID=1296121 RepID=A0AAJ8MGM8_9TREE
MDRRRMSGASASTSSRSVRESSIQVKNLRSPSTSSVTPRPDEDEDGKPRRTRGRNPLPPTSGPLFPPLPPKQPKNSPKNSPQAPSRSPAVRTPSAQWPTSALAASSELIPPAMPEGPLESSALEEDAISARSVSPEKTHVPSASNASLTPPPPTSEDTNEENKVEATAEGEGEGEEDWDQYRRHRRVKGFRNTSQAEVKEEPDLDDSKEDEEETPVKTRSSRLNGNGLGIAGSGENTPIATTLYPTLTEPIQLRDTVEKDEGKTSSCWTITFYLLRFAGHHQVEENDNAIADDDDEEGEADEAEEEVKDVTRCVCQKEDIDVMMIQCDKCNVWQHGECMGIWGDEEAPDEYFCEECKPERHQPLMKWIRRQGRKSGNAFIPPTPENLRNLHNDRDDYPPSQSKRWAEEEETGEPPKPTPPPKPTSRSHHKREIASPAAESYDGRRSTRGKPPPQSVSRDKPPSLSHKNDSTKSLPKGGPSSKRVRGISSISPDRDSQSPQPNSGKEPKRRSTMNSRDAAYEEEVKAALEASRIEMMSPTNELEESAIMEEKDKERGEKRRRDDEDEAEDKERSKKGKRKRDDEEGSVEPAGSKIKHPNQYTYRPKPPAAAAPAPVAAPSPARRVAASTPVPSAQPAHHEHGTRRAGALAAAPVIYHPLTPESANHLSWFLPDHLAAFADLLPSSHPNALEVPAPRVLSYLPRNHYHNQRYGPFSEDRDENGKLVLPEEPAGRDVTNDDTNTTQLDPPARPRYPVKRITVAEMKKRARNVLEYVGRIQMEEGKRQERARLLGIKVIKPTSVSEVGKDQDQDQDGDVNMDQPLEGETVQATSTLPLPDQTKSMQLMDELTRDLINFQESFNHNGISNGYASPVPPTTSTFSGTGISLPPTPVLPSAMAQSQSQGVVESKAEIEAEAEAGPPQGSVAPSPLAEKLVEPEETVKGITTDTATENATAEIIEGEGLDVYRQGVTKTVITTEAEKDVAEKVDEIVAETTA